MSTENTVDRAQPNAARNIQQIESRPEATGEFHKRRQALERLARLLRDIDKSVAATLK